MLKEKALLITEKPNLLCATVFLKQTSAHLGFFFFL